MKALVTGATTPLGAAICRALGRDCLAVANLREEIARPLLGSGVAYRELDLARPRDLHDLLFGDVVRERIDTIVHLAIHRKLSPETAAVHALNVEALRNILSYCDAHPTVRRVIVRSFADVYRVDHKLPTLVSEDHPMSYPANAPQWLRDRVEADALACARMGLGRLGILVLRCADVFAHEMGSQIFDYVSSRVCLRPLGFDPMINLLSIADAARAFTLAAHAGVCSGVFNIAGADTLPLSACIRAMGRRDLPLPGPMLLPLYGLRRWVNGNDFSYALSGARLHYPALLDGTRAERVLVYQPVSGCLSRAATPERPAHRSCDY